MKGKKKRYVFHEAMKSRENSKKQKLKGNTKQRENYLNKRMKKGFKNNLFKDERIKNVSLKKLNTESMFNLNDDGPIYQSDMLGTRVITENSNNAYDDDAIAEDINKDDYEIFKKERNEKRTENLRLNLIKNQLNKDFKQLLKEVDIKGKDNVEMKESNDEKKENIQSKRIESLKFKNNSNLTKNNKLLNNFDNLLYQNKKKFKSNLKENIISTEKSNQNIKNENLDNLKLEEVIFTDDNIIKKDDEDKDKGEIVINELENKLKKGISKDKNKIIKENLKLLENKEILNIMENSDLKKLGKDILNYIITITSTHKIKNEINIKKLYTILKTTLYYMKNEIYEIIKRHIIRIQKSMNNEIKKSDEDNLELIKDNYILKISDMLIIKLTFELFLNKIQLDPIIQLALNTCSQYLLSTKISINNTNEIIKGLFIASLLSYISNINLRFYIPEPIVYIDKLLNKIFISRNETLENMQFNQVSSHLNINEILSLNDIIGIDKNQEYLCFKIINSTFDILNTCIETYSQNKGFVIIFKNIEDKLNWILNNNEELNLSLLLKNKIKDVIDKLSLIKEQLHENNEKELNREEDFNPNLNLIEQKELIVEHDIQKQNKKLKKRIKREKTRLNSDIRKDAAITTKLKIKEKRKVDDERMKSEKAFYKELNKFEKNMKGGGQRGMYPHLSKKKNIRLSKY